MGEINRPLRWMSVAYSSEPSRATARFWIRAPVTVSVLSTTFVRVSIVVMVPASRAQMYMRSEERRVGKECRSWLGVEPYKKKNLDRWIELRLRRKLLVKYC